MKGAKDDVKRPEGPQLKVRARRPHRLLVMNKGRGKAPFSWVGEGAQIKKEERVWPYMFFKDYSTYRNVY